MAVCTFNWIILSDTGLTTLPLSLFCLVSLFFSHTGSVSLEDLDAEEMALVLGGALGCSRARNMRKSVTCEGSLSSLTEEEAGIETQPQLCSSLEVCTVCECCTLFTL